MQEAAVSRRERSGGEERWRERRGMMQTVSAVREKAWDAAEQMSGEEPRCEMPRLEQAQGKKTDAGQEEKESKMVSYLRLRAFAKSIPAGTDADAIVMEEMRKKHECVD